MSQAKVTDRQLQVLALSLMVGDAAAAQHLGVSKQTVKNHLQVLYRVLGVRTRAQAAVRLGWLQLPQRYLQD